MFLRLVSYRLVANVCSICRAVSYSLSVIYASSNYVFFVFCDIFVHHTCCVVSCAVYYVIMRVIYVAVWIDTSVLFVLHCCHHDCRIVWPLRLSFRLYRLVFVRD